ncbi:unnamed protein product [Notodromas monacha]|uniref:BZIP domain-containing protein n=1 Tax=Notodromas monacha TaxID=399045 RepID=A0A7R9BQ02_9CRUS|nr:unnamed protein product [Notodromas monacha]CAG0919308.1 unnamed protein product [Notodromas monacha]
MNTDDLRDGREDYICAMLSSSDLFSGTGGAGDKYNDVPTLSPLSVDIEMTNGLALLNQTMNTHLSGGSLSDPWMGSPLSQKSPDPDLVNQMDALLKTEPLDLPCASPSDVELLQMSLHSDQNDFLQGPTLAELNAPLSGDLLDDLSFDDLMLPEDSNMRTRLNQNYFIPESSTDHILASSSADNGTFAHLQTRPLTLGTSGSVVASVDIDGQRYYIANSGLGVSGVQMQSILTSPGTMMHQEMPLLARQLEQPEFAGNSNNATLSSSVPSSSGMYMATTTKVSNAGIGFKPQPQNVGQHQSAQQKIQQLTFLASNLSSLPHKAGPMALNSPQTTQHQLFQQVGLLGTTVESPTTTTGSRRSSTASLCSDGISKLTLHNNILHQNRSKAPHQMRPRASTMSGAIGHRRPPKASGIHGGASTGGHTASGTTPQHQPLTGLAKNGSLLSSTPDIRLSSSCPSNSLELHWRKREPRTHLLSGGSLIESLSHGGSGSSLSTGSVLSPLSGGHDLSYDKELYNSDTEEDEEDSDADSNASSDDGYDVRVVSPNSRGGAAGLGHSARERYFWQYNVQAKGPKGQRLVLKNPNPQDPHVLDQVVDPVFNPVVAAQGIRHSGKARRGDGNDLTPSPQKLYNIGMELDGLNQAINDMTPVAELPYNDRPKSRKEKNKLASRACRLKKKAQHEANKLTLYGLQEEHRKLMDCIEFAKKLLHARVASVFNDVSCRDLVPIDCPISPQLEKFCDPVLRTRVAGRATEFVNSVLDKVKAGIPKGGLATLFK